MRIAIIGGGASGFFAAIQAKKNNYKAEVIIYEKNSNPLTKVRISGGGRCNLTNSFENITDLKQVYPRGYNLIKNLFKTFNHTDTYSWFENNGVKLITQEDQCVFPYTQDSYSVISCLIKEVHNNKVEIKTKHILKNIYKCDNKFILELNSEEKRIKETFDKVIITIGGASRKSNISFLEDLGLKINTPKPSLFSFNISDNITKLMGTVVENTIVSIPKTKFKSHGALLITHWGFSGPAILKLSSYSANELYNNKYKLPISINWINITNCESIQNELYNIVKTNNRKKIISVKPFNLQTRLWIYLLNKCNIDTDKTWGEIGKKNINKITEILTNDIYNIEGKSTNKEEFVTCGGISLENINKNTLECKTIPGLYFAGEVLDIDAVTGGFNLQAAWTTGYVAGRSAAISLKD